MEEQTKEVAVRSGTVVAEYLPPLTASGVQEQVNLIQTVMRQVMEGPSKDNPTGVHYGVVPGTKGKPSLYKAGAEKLSLVFRLRPIMSNAADIDVVEMGNGHREYRVRCHIVDQRGNELATGVGSCTTLESKYRYRRGMDFEVQDCDIPEDYREQKDKYRKDGFGAKQVDGAWKWVKYSTEGRGENPDIADTYNTVLKMAKKRAYVDGILSSTAASDIFTQDVEDLPAEMLGGGKPAQSAATSGAAHHGPQRKSATSAAAPAPTAATAPAGEKNPDTVDLKVAQGVVMKHYAPKGKSAYHSYTLDTMPGAYFQSADEVILELMEQHRLEKDTVELTYHESHNGQYTNRRITEVAGVVDNATENVKPEDVENEDVPF